MRLVHQEGVARRRLHRRLSGSGRALCVFRLVCSQRFGAAFYPLNTTACYFAKLASASTATFGCKCRVFCQMS